MAERSHISGVHGGQPAPAATASLSLSTSATSSCSEPVEERRWVTAIGPSTSSGHEHPVATIGPSTGSGHEHRMPASAGDVALELVPLELQLGDGGLHDVADADDAAELDDPR